MPGESQSSGLIASLALFQSTPGINAGRILPTTATARAWCKFQSTPGINAGRIGVKAAVREALECFNPRPALMPGESASGHLVQQVHLVSIHARH